MCWTVWSERYALPHFPDPAGTLSSLQVWCDSRILQALTLKDGTTVRECAQQCCSCRVRCRYVLGVHHAAFAAILAFCSSAPMVKDFGRSMGSPRARDHTPCTHEHDIQLERP